MIFLRQGFVRLRREVCCKRFHTSINVCIAETSSVPIISHKLSDSIVWIDMEMTGLDPDKNKILEVACLVTNANLKIISGEFDIVIHQPDEDLNTMDSWNTLHHKKSGLLNASRTSTITISDAETKLLSFLSQYIPKNTCPLAGNSVYMDRMFLRKYMPQVDDYLHYRIIDVSTIKEVIRRWNHALYKAAPQKNFSHRAMDDIKESLKELEYYRECMFQ